MRGSGRVPRGPSTPRPPPLTTAGSQPADEVLIGRGGFAGAADVEHRRKEPLRRNFFDLGNCVHADDDLLDRLDAVSGTRCPYAVLAVGGHPPSEDGQPAGD